MMDRNHSFVRAIDAMRSSGVLFWVEQGTLLGLVRDQCLIPWDHDIDFGIWNEPNHRQRVVDSLCRLGYVVEKLKPETQCLHFLREESSLKVDVTLYVEANDHASTAFLVEPYGWRHFLSRLVLILRSNDPRDLLPKLQGSYWVKRVGRICVRVLARVPIVIREACAVPLGAVSGLFPSLTICRFNVPAVFLKKLKTFVYCEREFLVPEDCEGYLSFVYGQSWRTPKREWDWLEGTGGLKKVPYRRDLHE